MPKSDNKHAINLYNSIEKHISHTAAEDFIEKLPLSKSAVDVKKSKWASGVCAYLDERFTEDEIRKIRMGCSCVKHSEDNLTNAWCICTLGYTEKMFSHAMSRYVQVELLESVKTGGEKCVMKIL